MKSMKKLVRAGLILLASVVVLAGCKNDSVPEVPKYTVKFDTAHGTTPASITVESGTKLTTEQLQALPDTEDNIFEGWYDGETQAKGGEYTVTKDVTLLARWRNRDTVASVTFDPSSTKFYCGATVKVTLTSADEGATIKYHLGDENWQDYSGAITITSDTTITAYATKAGLKDSAETTATYTVRKLTGISITPPTRTVYSVGESFDSAGMVVTATYDDGEERTVEGTITSETSSLTESAGINKGVTVRYTEGEITKQSSFTVVVFPEGVKILTDYTSPNHTDDTWTYVEFGEWPQTKANVEGISLQQVVGGRGYFKDNYYTDDKGNYYVKVTANPYEDGYIYSDKSDVTEGSEVYFKVEPIIWRVLNSKDGKYNKSENPLLLAENILTGGIQWDDSKNNYMESNIRKWLNGNSSGTFESDYNGDAGFLQTAFTPGAQGVITSTSVDNSARSTNPESNATLWNSGKNTFASGDTEDKIFLLSEQEATKEAYGFAVYNASGEDNTRIRVTTDYAKATGAYQSATAGYGGWWWVRSPYYNIGSIARIIHYDGNASYNFNISVSNMEVGIVPALSISINGN